jgi:diguanylate cyclase (GGDEF)-like protein
MNKDEMALYLNEHPEFFNDYPELLAKIHAIQIDDLPVEPSGTLNLTERILKRAQDDREHLKTSLEWLVDITQANERIQEHLYKIEQLLLTSTDLDQMVRQLREEIAGRFEIPHVVVALVDGADHFIESEMHERYGESVNDALKFIGQEAVSQWFQEEIKPILRGQVKNDSAFFISEETKSAVQSEAIIPIMVRDQVAGVIVFGSEKPFHFHEGLRTDFLEQMAEKLSIAVSNIFLIDRLKKQPVIDKQTGLYNRSYLEPVLAREFDMAKRRNKSLFCIKLHIDYFPKLIDTYGEPLAEKILKVTGDTLKANSRRGDILIHTDVGEFVILLPEIDSNGAVQAVERFRSALAKLPLDKVEGMSSPGFSCGIAGFPDDQVTNYKDLLQSAGQALSMELNLKNKQVG